MPNVASLGRFVFQRRSLLLLRNRRRRGSRWRRAAGITTLAATWVRGLTRMHCAGCGLESAGVGIHGLQAVSQAVGRSFFDILIFHPPLSHEHLAIGWQFNVVGSVQIFEDLLRDPLEHGRGNLSALMQSNCGIQNHGDGDRRIVDRSESGERSHVLGVRIGMVAGSTFCAVPVFPAEL